MTNTVNIDDFFRQAEKQIFFRNPTNILEQKIAFFNSDNTYNPQFTYDKFESTIDFVWAENAIAKLTNSEIKFLYQARLEELKLRVLSVSTIGKSAKKFTQYSTQLYGLPNQETDSIAEKIVKHM